MMNAPTADTKKHALTHAERCRTLVATARTAGLSTMAREPEGHPYGSLVAITADREGRPLLLLSTLAEHTANLEANERASILVTEPGLPDADPLALGRVTLLGACRAIEAPEIERARAVYLAAHPRAATYVDFKDFRFYRLEPVALRFIAGFGRMAWVSAEAYRTADVDALAAASAGILDHMNDDHADALLLYARVLAAHEDASAARMMRVDRYGFDIEVATPAGRSMARIPFTNQATTADAARVELIALLRRAREGG